MIRLIVELLDANDHFHADCPIRKYYRTVDIDLPFVENLLKGNPAAHLTATLVGAEIIAAGDEGGEKG